MSMFNLVFGDSGEFRGYVLLALIPLERADVGRFRDCWIENDPGRPGCIRLAVYTRNGGGNRWCYAGEVETKDRDCGQRDCFACIITHRLPKHELYLSDQDDSFDRTYATIYFKLPDDLNEVALEKLKAVAVDPVDMSEVWQRAIDGLKTIGKQH